jgi:hypothetical protein
MDNNHITNHKAVYSYSRARAIEDGILVDVTDMAKAIGIKWHVAITQSLWSDFIKWTDDDRKRQGLDDTESRLWHIVFTLHLAIKKADKYADVIFFELDILPRDGISYRVKRTRLKAVVSAGDYFEPVITVMLPNED